MRYRFTLMALAAAAEGVSTERVADPAEAAVFIRVLGTVEVEVDTGAQSPEERDVELGTGSGFVFTPYGHVLTNHHVVSGDSFEARLGDREVRARLSVDRIEVLLRSQDPDSPPLVLPASVEVSDRELDLAILSVTGASLPYLALGDSDAASPGEDVRVYGFPFGRQVEVAREGASGVVPAVSVTRGAVSAVRGDETGSAAYLQTSATVNPGNSGGPLVDAEGFVLGVVRLKLKEGDGIGFAIPVNSVKDFLEANGYGGLVPVERLRLGGEEILEGKGLTLRLPESIEDVSPSKLRVFGDPSPASVAFASDRVVTPWDVARLEQALLSGEAFGAFRATGLRRSQTLSSGRLVLGSATGQDADGFEAKIEYAILENGPEKVVLRYTGSAEAVAFNRSVLVESLSSASVASLLSSPVEESLAPRQFSWEPIELPSPSAPSVVFPRGWDQESSAPFPCAGLPAIESATAASPPGDFRISLRGAWWGAGPGASSAARACSDRPGRLGEPSYGYTVDYLGVRYVVSGIFTETEPGLLQLEVVAPADAAAFVSELTAFWIETNLRSLLPR